MFRSSDRSALAMACRNASKAREVSTGSLGREGRGSISCAMNWATNGVERVCEMGRSPRIGASCVKPVRGPDSRAAVSGLESRRWASFRATSERVAAPG